MITSLSNPKIKEIKRLRDRKERLQSGTYLVEGLRIVAEAIQQNAPLEMLIVAPELLRSQYGLDMVAKQQQNGLQIMEVSETVFRTISSKDGPQGVMGIVKQSLCSLNEFIPPLPNSIWVGVDSVQDPGNLGTILRTLDAVGGQGVILLDHCVDPYDPSCVRASMGSIFSLKLIKSNFHDFTDWKQTNNLPMFGTSGIGEKDYHTVIYPHKMILLMGSERQGLLEHHLKLCDEIIRIPMVGTCDSLNLAVATAVVLYEMYNFHRDH
jgi:RNA methyltransferase, TrmH family